MPITPEEIRALAAEARLNITREELPEVATYLNSFLAVVERLNGLDLNDAPLFDFAEGNSCPMRDDEIVKYPRRDDILAAAPGRDGNFYRAARILEE
ncbi:MAG: aspartyl/glutamyl-tRNA amidotransferase subunit C [Synergistaceae bacterium]|nr:aspartyl/glutamyl-tRNA amidotransferase subunit C [Synergistaceae bacterium]